MQVHQKISPLCSVFGECGGCLYQDIPYADELIIKQNIVQSLISEKISLDASVYKPIVASPQEYGYRHRIDLKLARTKDRGIVIGFSPEKRKRVLVIDDCPVARREIAQSIPRVKQEALERLTAKYRQANIVIRCGDEGKVDWGGIGRHSLARLADQYLWTEIRGRKIFYSLDTFFQANLFILPKLFDYIRSLAIWTNDVSFYDLYGGVGLFSVGLADLAQTITLIEDVGASTELAKYNVAFNHFSHIKVLVGKVEEHLNKSLDEDKTVNKVAMIDPPRDGLSPAAAAMLSRQRAFSAIIYLSCHPESLARDLKIFAENYWHIDSITPFDFFPRTKHIETLVVMRCKKS